MANILMVVGVTFVVAVLGMGMGYWIWLKTRPKKMTWNAKVYQLTEGVIPPLKNKEGEIVSDVELRGLRPYTKDIIERVERGKGITVYRLIKLNRTVPAVTTDAVDQWGTEKDVSVLIDEENTTLLKKGYDVNGRLIFRPVPYDRVNMMINEMTVRKDRLHKEKDILQAITPFVVVGIAMLALVAISWIFITGLVDISDNTQEGEKYLADKMVEASNNYKDALGYIGSPSQRVVQQPDVGNQKPQSIE